jgi:hypothetical protein
MRELILLGIGYVVWLYLSRRVLSGSADAFREWGQATSRRRLLRRASPSSS